MIKLASFTFNPFQENTYVLWDKTMECIIVDPGCYDRNQENELATFIKDNKLKPVQVVNTHCHIDHVFGNAFCVNTYKIPLYFHQLEDQVLAAAQGSAALYGLQYTESPEADFYLVEGERVFFGDSSLSIRFTPGHSPGSISLVAAKEKFVLGGDVLFQGSIGRTDLPGGDLDTLLTSIRKEMLSLPDDYTVYSGHGLSTTIGAERHSNPYLNSKVH